MFGRGYSFQYLKGQNFHEPQNDVIRLPRSTPFFHSGRPYGAGWRGLARDTTTNWSDFVPVLLYQVHTNRGHRHDS